MAKIMICDDSKTILNILEKKLTAAGHQVVGKAKDGDEGFSVYAQTKPDLAILDVTMPNKDGRECLEAIMKLNSSAKVIMLSALHDENVINNCLGVGAKAFVSKDKLYKEEDFKQEILKVIDRILNAA
jgi:two-component system chemotaxis response regulator CheY